MTEDHIERTVERRINELDRAFMNGALSQEEYDRRITKIDQWASQQYRYAEPCGRLS